MTEADFFGKFQVSKVQQRMELGGEPGPYGHWWLAWTTARLFDAVQREACTRGRMAKLVGTMKYSGGCSYWPRRGPWEASGSRTGSQWLPVRQLNWAEAYYIASNWRVLLDAAWPVPREDEAVVDRGAAGRRERVEQVWTAWWDIVRPCSEGRVVGESDIADLDEAVAVLQGLRSGGDGSEGLGFVAFMALVELGVVAGSMRAQQCPNSVTAMTGMHLCRVLEQRLLQVIVRLVFPDHEGLDVVPHDRPSIWRSLCGSRQDLRAAMESSENAQQGSTAADRAWAFQQTTLSLQDAAGRLLVLPWRAVHRGSLHDRFDARNPVHKLVAERLLHGV